ncbi:hypothetical protein [Mycobacterium sp.]|uniref:hypothetical protein n=1 Tax=Mycobacterium sp. TaxID=1785 RepID=UPI003BAF2DBD
MKISVMIWCIHLMVTQQVGNRCGISKTRLTTILREQGITIRRQGLTNEQVTDAAGRYFAGRSLGVDRGPLQPLHSLSGGSRRC